MECSEALDFLYESFDGQLTPTQHTLLDAHRRTCFACANTLSRAERFQELLLQVPQLAVPRGLEDRIIERVFTASHVTTHRGETLRSIIESFTNWRSFGLALGTTAAALALILLTRDVILQNTGHSTAVETSITAEVVGALDLQTTSGEVHSAGATVAIAPGDVLTSNSTKPATVALTPSLAITLSSGTQLRIGKLHMDPRTGDPDVVSVRVDHGTVGVRENLKGQTGGIHVSTDLATVVPTGTIFTVSAGAGVTHVAVGQGSVAVYLPGETFNVLAGSEARITAAGHTLAKLRPNVKVSH